MTMVFVKTCLRDARLAALQMRAAEHFFKGATRWIYCIDEAEKAAWEKIALPTSKHEVITERELDAEALLVADPYHRQQWCKIVAPWYLGDQIQLDSDFVPCRPFDLVNFAANPWWDYTTPNENNLKMFAAGMAAYGVPYEFSFMCTPGWFITRALIKDLLNVRGDLGRLYRNPPALLSEYNILGQWAFAHPAVGARYKWNLLREYQAPNPLAQAIYDANAMVHHGKEHLLPEQFANGIPIYDIPRYRRRGLRP